MKRIVSIIITLCLVLGSFSFAFGVDWSTTDQSNLANIKNYLTYGSYSAAGWLSRIYSYIDQYMPTYGGQTLTNNNLSDIKNMLGFGGTVDLESALSIMNDHLTNIDSALSGSSGSGIAAILENILNELAYTNAGGTVIHGIQVLVGYINSIRLDASSINTNTSNLYSVTNTNLPAIKTNTDNIYTVTNTNLPSISSYLRSINLKYTDEFGWLGSNTFTIPELLASGMYQTQNKSISNFYDGTLDSLSALHSFNVQSYNQLFNRTVGVSFNRTSWDDLSSITFTPYSLGNGLIRMLQYIQTPIARLAYVHASDQEIAAREKAEANQTAVVNNFIDSSGFGSATPSNITDIAAISSGVKSNFNTGVSASGVFDLFTSDHTSGWFSQDTANELNGVSSTRTLKAVNTYNTPLLDSQMNEIMQLFEKDKKQ